jgi:hypothetical protein
MRPRPVGGLGEKQFQAKLPLSTNARPQTPRVVLWQMT